jgi:hypothetical protein
VVTLRIEHPVPDFDAWRRAFDADPLDRRGSGVRAYRVMRSLDDPGRVMVDLDFDGGDAAEAMRARLLELWGRAAAGGLIGDQSARLAEIVEAAEP